MALFVALLLCGCGPDGECPVRVCWDGSAVVLHPQDSVRLSPAPGGDIAVVVLNVDPRNNAGQLASTAGNNPPEVLEVPALTNTPVVQLRSFNGETATFVNTSPQALLSVSIFGPGFGAPQPLVDDGTLQELPAFASRQTLTQARYQRLVLRSPDQLSVFLVFVGGEWGLYAVHAPSTTSECPLPGGGRAANGYTCSSSGDELALVGNWMGWTLYVANLSPIVSRQGSVALMNL